MGIVTRTLANNLTTGLTGDKRGTPIIINGDMAVAQRATSSTATGIKTCDRWNVRTTNTDNLALTQAQSSTVPGYGFKHSYKYDTTTIESDLASDEALAIETRIEANTMQSLKYGTAQAEATTLTFWAKSSLTGVHGIYIRTHDGAQEFVQSYTIAAADTWQKVAINIPANTAKVINNDTGIGWWIQWILAAGTGIDGATLGSWHDNATEIAPTSQVNLMANTSYEFLLTGVQLEIGTFTADTTPPFPFESFQDNLIRCSRYYTEINQNGANGWRTFPGRINGSADVENIGITLPTFLRHGNPTATKSGSCVAQVWDENGYHATSAGGGTFSILTDSGDNTPFLNCKQTGFSGLHNEGAGNVSFVIGDPSIAIDAEL
jgi:hypothetical protein